MILHAVENSAPCLPLELNFQNFDNQTLAILRDGLLCFFFCLSAYIGSYEFEKKNVVDNVGF